MHSRSGLVGFRVRVDPLGSPVMAAALLAAACCWNAPLAFAHGGQFRAPGGAPANPGYTAPKPGGGSPPPTTPPSAPVPSRPATPHTPAPPTPRPATPGGPSTVPGLPSTATGRPTDLPGRPRGGRPPEVTQADWESWWLFNRWAFFPERRLDPHRAAAVITPTGAHQDPRSLAEALRTRRRLVAERVLVPFLLQQLDPAERSSDEVISAALLALARVSTDVQTPALLLAHARDRDRSSLVRESAALGLGLLRRSDAALQLDGVRLDTLRRDLIDLADREDAPGRTRSFALLSLGLLGDQPFGTEFTAHGRVTCTELGRRLAQPRADADLTVALLTALGMQPSSGMSPELSADLRRIVLGQRVHRRSWDATERSHALTALARQHSEGWWHTLRHALGHRRSPTPLVRAALLALGAEAPRLDPIQAQEALSATREAMDRALDPTTRGVALLALGRLLRADLEAGSERALNSLSGGKELISLARNVATPCRGFALVALGVALKAAATSKAVGARSFSESGRKELIHHLERSANPELRAACIVALGLAAHEEAANSPVLQALLTSLEDRGEIEALRAHCAVAVALGARSSTDASPPLARALEDTASPAVQAQAALALSMLGGRPETRALLEQVKGARTQQGLARLVTALGRLGDPLAAEALISLARDGGRSDESRALALAALGLLLDPEPRPSLMRLGVDSNYLAATDALLEASDIY